MITHFVAVFFVVNNTSDNGYQFQGLRKFFGWSHILWRSFVREIKLSKSSSHQTRPVPSKTENCSSVNLLWLMNTETTVIELWQSERTTDIERWKGFEWLYSKPPLPLVISIMPCIMVLLLLTRPDWWSWGTRLNRGSKSLLYMTCMS